MCGIAGYFEPGSGETPPAERIEAMTRSLSHRGPDDEGYLRGPGLALGHRRLSIIDLASGHQPMRDAGGRLAIVFNGEIYNYRSLRDELAGKGHRFTTGSDTEVILEAYAAWGDACVERLRGMFAFALWDEPRRRLFLARDRVGIKPLYYAWDGRRLHFGSEIKAILADPTVPRDLDVRALDEYLSYLYVPAPRSIFQAVRKLRAGHTLAVSAPEGLEEREYWDLRFEPDSSADPEATAGDLLRVLEDSVRVHLESDVPVGAFLSGGLDSSAVVALMSRMVPEPVRTASIGFEESGFDELPYARAVAKACGTRAYEKTVRASAAAIFDRLAWHYDEPFGDSSMVPTYYVSAVAREQVKVCLSGDGGDENFAGYRRYRFDHLENRIRAGTPAWLRAGLRPVAAAYPKLDWMPRFLRGKTLLTNLTRSPERAYFHTMTWYHPEMKRALYQPWLEEALDGHDAFSAMEPHFRRSEGWHPLSRIQYVDIKTYLVDDILTKVDRASMAHSLEVRVPVLDHLVMERAARIPADLKLHGGTGKYVFKKAVAPLLAPEIIHRPKMGFSVPLAAWLRGELRRPFEETVLAPESYVSRYFRGETMRGWWDAHQRGTSNHSHRLWALLVLEHWGRRFASG